MKFDIVVVGGGHAGLEAAWMASQYSELKVAIITMPGVPLASAPCNPAVGGVGKGQVVREIDALGGIMGRLADFSAIQYRTLNASKGHAVQSTRVQIDKEAYARHAEEQVLTRKNLQVIRSRVIKIDSIQSKDTNSSKNEYSFALIIEKDLNLSHEGPILARKVILTTGTFLNGKLHTGREQVAGGRRDCAPSVGMRDLFEQIKTLPVRFKTGTPPRLHRKSIDFSQLEEQPSDPQTRNFHWDHAPFQRHMPQVSCYLTNTEEKTLNIIREHREESPIFNGQIQGVGPRYCPSIEDKAFRYPDRNSHHVFIEPESLELDTFYPNGVSTSLPAEVQQEFIRTIPGLEKAEIVIPGYAVEYDVVDTSCLNSSLEYQDRPGLFFAGQVNGTSGYEEAAGQGLVAGINAALQVLQRPPLHLDRHDSYIGVMVEDLISNRRDEPYRLFTARSENRLSIREDNVFIRMAPYRQRMHLQAPLDQFYQRWMMEYEILSQLCDQTTYQATTLTELLKQSGVDPVDYLTQELIKLQLSFLPQVIQCVAVSKKYEGYILRAEQQNKKVQKLDHLRINWQSLVDSPNISFECKLRISQIRPETFGQLRHMEGIRPATLAMVAGMYY